MVTNAKRPRTPTVGFVSSVPEATLTPTILTQTAADGYGTSELR